MKVRTQTTKLTEIGKLDFVLRMPTAPRIRMGIKTTCRRCGKAITDETFICGFKKGYANMLFHERCLGRDATRLLAAHDAKPAAAKP